MIVIMTLCCGLVRNYSNGVSDSKSRKNTFVTYGAQSSVLFTKGKQDRIPSLEIPPLHERMETRKKAWSQSSVSVQPSKASEFYLL